MVNRLQIYTVRRKQRETVPLYTSAPMAKASVDINKEMIIT